MGQLSINFIVESVREANQDPCYRVVISTGLSGSTPAFVDGDLLVIERKSLPEGSIDVFYGVAKASDFVNLRKASPNPGQTMYRVHGWTLMFYNQRTMDEALALMKSQIDILSEDISIYSKATSSRSETHFSPEF